MQVITFMELPSLSVHASGFATGLFFVTPNLDGCNIFLAHDPGLNIGGGGRGGLDQISPKFPKGGDPCFLDKTSRGVRSFGFYCIFIHDCF
jgi:hypothetical protein